MLHIIASFGVKENLVICFSLKASFVVFPYTLKVAQMLVLLVLLLISYGLDFVYLIESVG